MKELTVKQLAAISGVTVRTLHHYDEIGLLKPARVGANGYRYYGRPELLRLQRILFHRELGVSLGEIGDLLALEGEDQVGALRRHRDQLVAEGARLAVLIDTIDHTIASITGASAMSSSGLYKGFSAEKQASHEKWLIERYGEPMRGHIAHSQKKFGAMTEAERAQVLAEGERAGERIAQAYRDGLAATSDAVNALVIPHRAWIAQMWDRPCSAEAYAGLADLYQSHPEFVARYEAVATGFTDYLVRAMKAHAAREVKSLESARPRDRS